MRVLFLFACLLLCSISCNTSRAEHDEVVSEPLTTVILVRHAEKDFGDDPDLTPAGQERAALLAEMLRNTQLDAVYSTDTKRTRQTATPTAEAHDLSVSIYDAGELQVVSNRIARKHRGGTILVVGHSNTTPALANHLTDSDAHPRFSELDYGNLLVVTLPPAGTPRVLQLRY
ncbi:broad specificity phosphatase PhoE [Neolewinella xylanilytica]|uniref:Broad specificity phosphatase PhoE n=1 Tax=Neolewinella xylanilytica TaxID=1514080 RepID=A0A2S6I5E1_9BACT|nr:phosphoglycerate mutase family protein [Neolewinella xylanilytica]PPK86349.1 broad specificity phosphatase PhoE [Neolewinella xylanilytica]